MTVADSWNVVSTMQSHVDLIKDLPVDYIHHIFNLGTYIIYYNHTQLKTTGGGSILLLVSFQSKTDSADAGHGHSESSQLD
jgi:hypothetical protein